MAERDEEEEGVDNKGTVVYNNIVHASKKVTKYISYEKLGNDVVSFIKRTLPQLYADTRDGIADGIAIEYENYVFIVDSGKEKGRITLVCVERNKYQTQG